VCSCWSPTGLYAYAYLIVVFIFAPPVSFSASNKKDWKESRALSSEDPVPVASEFYKSQLLEIEEVEHNVRNVPSLGFTLSAKAFTMVSAPTCSSNIDDDITIYLSM